MTYSNPTGPANRMLPLQLPLAAAAAAAAAMAAALAARGRLLCNLTLGRACLHLRFPTLQP